MFLYSAKRLALMIPTLLGILFLNFAIVQFAPGGPVETFLLKQQGSAEDLGALSAGQDISKATEDYLGMDTETQARLAEFEEKFHLNRPFLERFGIMVWNYAHLDFGVSMFRNGNLSVWDLIVERIPVSIALGLWSSLIIIFISIPLGIAKAVKDGTRFDILTSAIIIIAYALPSILVPVLLRMYFAGGADWGFFPLRGLSSLDNADFTIWQKVKDYFWHIALPVMSMAITGFATKTLLTKNSFLEEIQKQYVMTARAKGLSENRILYGHVFRNAMLIIISGFPAIFISVFFTGSIIVETTFSLDGLGRLGLQAVLERDYPIVFGTLFIFSLIGLIVHLIADLTYAWVDPRINFEAGGQS